MRKKLLTIFFSFLLFFYCSAQKTPKRELRGAWITTHLSLDWPRSSDPPATQRSALISILDQHKATGMNVMYFQVRNQSDALYPSSIEPWSSTLTGTQGRDPGWDPLQFAIDECHKRGMELHAWLNPYRAVATASQLNSFVPGHVAKQHPEWLLNNGSTITLNPGIPAVRDYIINVITDITQRYDVDGIHFDDYFYPPAPIRDTAAYNADTRGLTHADWRRDNINMFIRRVNETVTSLKPWVKFGVSPSGIYLSKTSTQDGSATSTGALQHYKDGYADTKKWLQQGWVDYIAPQVYWYIGQPGSDYKVLIPWWNDQASGRHIYIGQAIYKVNDPAQGAAWANRSQIPNQMRMNRDAAYPNVYGEIAFRTAFLRSNPLNVRDSIRLNIYKKPALPPTMPWRDNTPPQAPSTLTAARQTNNSYILNWTKPATTANELDKVRQFVIYRSENAAININDTANILAITPTDVNTYTDNTAPANKTYYYTVTSVDRLYNESAPSNVTDYEAPTITCPGSQALTLNTSCSATLPDYTSVATVNDDVSAPGDISVTQSPAAGTVINGAGNTTITLTATDASGKKSTCNFDVNAGDKEAPVITSINTSVINGSTTRVSTDSGKCSFTATDQFDIKATDNCNNTLSYSYTLTTNGVTGKPVSAATLKGAVLPKGVTSVSWTVTDNSGNASNYSYSIEVHDNEAPVITDAYTNPSILHPPNNKMRDVKVFYYVADNCGTVTTSLSVTSNEDRLNTPEDDEPGSDYEVIDDHRVKLRAARSGTGDGRIYTITITATDVTGNVSKENVTVLVPHDRSDLITSAQAATGKEEISVQKGLKVKALSNPSANRFSLITSSNMSEPLQLRVTDNLSRVIETKNGISANGTIYLGSNYRPGVYYVEVIQGNKRVTLKLIKQSK